MSWPISGRSRSSSASCFRSPASPATTRSPSLAAQRPPPIAIEIGPSASCVGEPSSASTSIVSSTIRPGTTSSHSSSRRWITALSSNSFAASRSFERSGDDRSDSVTLIGTSTSVTIVASCFETRASSACSVRFCLRFAPEISSTAPSTPSRSPNCCSSWAAVLSPIPGTPGMLSEVSPLSPMKSVTSSGGTP